jgi:excisionase family DNA binding protein
MQTISIVEAARRLNVSHHTVGKWISSGLLVARVFPGGRRRIEVDELERFWDSLPITTPNREVSEFREVPKPSH